VAHWHVGKTNGKQAFSWLTQEATDALSKPEMVYVSDHVRSDGYRAVMATPEGVGYADAHLADTTPDNNIEHAFGNPEDTDKAAAPAASNGNSNRRLAPAVGSIEIEKGIKPKNPSRARSRESAYPFDRMEIGDSFHVPVTAQNDDPIKNLSSSVSNANQKYFEREKDENGDEIIVSTRTMERKGQKYEINKYKGMQLRRFYAEKVDDSDPSGPGVRVFRVELTKKDLAGVNNADDADEEDDDENGEGEE